MLPALLLGTILIAATVVVQTVGLILLSKTIARIVRWFRLHQHDLGRTVAMVATVLGLFAIHTVEIWLWASALLYARVTNLFEDALYQSTAAFSTMGTQFPLGQESRLLTALESVNGFILIGWSIAFLIAASTRFGPFRVGEHF
jgi:hypothetical protein